MVKVGGLAGIVVVVLVSSCTLDRMGQLDPLGSDAQAGAGGAGGTGGTAATGGTGTGGMATGGTAGTGTGGTAGTGVGGTAGAGGTAGLGGSAGTGGTVTLDPPWWDTGWKRRRPLEITNPSDEELEVGFQVPLSILDGTDPSSKASWRVLHWNGTSWTNRPRVIERVNEKTWIWFTILSSIPGVGSDESYWLYTDNDGASEPPFAGSIFEFHTFFGMIQPTSWPMNGNVSFVTNGVRLDGTGSGASIRSPIQFPPGHAIDFAMTVDQPLKSSSSWFCGGFQREKDFDNVRPWVLWISRQKTTISPEFYDSDSINWKGSTVSIDGGVEHIYGIERFRRKNIFRYDHEAVESNTWGYDYDTELQIRFSAYNDAIIRLRYARIRKARDPSPVVVTGSVQEFP